MTLVMGVLNATPDSFSDGGSLVTVKAAIAYGLELVARGATIIDVGGESTRPGAERVDAAEESRRVLPVIAALAGQGIQVSVDTMRASTALEAVRAGAQTINDVSGGLADPAMLDVVAETGVDYVAMHWRGHAKAMQAQAHYADVVGEVMSELVARRDAAVAAGVGPDRIILDPGIGFSKLAEHNWALLRAIGQFNQLGHRVLVGASRKRFLGDLLDGREPERRDVATAAISAWCALQGIWGVRTHEVAMQRDAISVGSALASIGVMTNP